MTTSDGAHPPRPLERIVTLERSARGQALVTAAYPGYLRQSWRRFVRNRVSLAAAIICALIVPFSFGAPLISRYITHQSYQEQNLMAAFARPGETVTYHSFVGGSREVTTTYYLGSDEFGRDVLTRLAYGGRISLSVSLLTLLMALTLGVSIGMVAGYYGGWVESLTMRTADVFLALPWLFILILVATVVNNTTWIVESNFYRKQSWLLVPMVIAALSWPGLSRLVRGEVQSLREREFVEASRVLGASDRRLLLMHMLPNFAPLLIVWGVLAIPQVILVEASLSYLGFGVQIPIPSWGNMLTGATTYFHRAPYLVLLPGGMIFITTLSINLLGNGLRDALDPKLTR